ncbi:MAG: LysM peptidoglycan-binding domain-containing protein [Proteobacteria bacterium]|nr:LysM peptidoglycan-binding domain-containing protein [Pseudomonadota bacterium]
MLGSGIDHKDGEQLIVAVPDKEAKVPGKRRVFYRVVTGDSLGSIAKAFGVARTEIATWNGLEEDANLHPKMVLLAWVAPTFDADKHRIMLLDDADLIVVTRGSAEHLDLAEQRTGRVRAEYVAQGKEKLADIARRYGMGSHDLARINRISYDTVLTKGQKVIVYTVKDPGRSPRAAEQWGKTPRGMRGRIAGQHATGTASVDVPEDASDETDPADDVDDDALKPATPATPTTKPTVKSDARETPDAKEGTDDAGDAMPAEEPDSVAATTVVPPAVAKAEKVAKTEKTEKPEKPEKLALDEQPEPKVVKPAKVVTTEPTAKVAKVAKVAKTDKTDKVAKAEKTEKTDKVEKTDKTDKVAKTDAKTEKTDKVAKTEKTDKVAKTDAKTEKTDKVAKTEKTETTEKTEQPTAKTRTARTEKAVRTEKVEQAEPKAKSRPKHAHDDGKVASDMPAQAKRKASKRVAKQTDKPTGKHADKRAKKSATHESGPVESPRATASEPGPVTRPE